MGNGSAGLSIFASVNGAKGHENGTVWSETTLDSGGAVDISSGRDTTLTGALVNGNSVTADVVATCLLPACRIVITMIRSRSVLEPAAVSLWLDDRFRLYQRQPDKMHSNYDSVLEQSGIYAGQGGFDITVGSHTQLNGAVIASRLTRIKPS